MSSSSPSRSYHPTQAPGYGESLYIILQRNDPKLNLVRHTAAEILESIRKDYGLKNGPQLGTIPIAPGHDINLDLGCPVDGILLAGAWVIHLLVQAKLPQHSDAQETLALTRNLPVVLVKVCRTFLAHHRTSSYIYRDLLAARLLDAIGLIVENNRHREPCGGPGRAVIEGLRSWVKARSLSRGLRIRCKAVVSKMLLEMGVHSLDDWRTPTNELYCTWLFGRADWLTSGTG